MKLSALSTEYVLCPMTVTINGALVSPTSDAVEIAIVASGTTVADGDFVAASWEPNTTSARLLIGPDSTFGSLTAGFWDVYTRVTDNPEIPVLHHGLIEIR